MVEIREFLDSEGQMTSSEVVNLSEEAKNIGPMDEGKMDEVMEKLQNTMVGADPATTLDDHASFVREIALLSSARELQQAQTGNVDSPSDFDFLDELERRESAQQQDERSHVFGSAKSGWKKGFFSQEKPKKVAKAAKVSSAPAAAVPVPPDSKKPATVTFKSEPEAPAVVVGVAASSSAPEEPSVQQPPLSHRAVTERAAPVAPSAGNVIGTGAAKSLAFTGVVKERL